MIQFMMEKDNLHDYSIVNKIPFLIMIDFLAEVDLEVKRKALKQALSLNTTIWAANKIVLVQFLALNISIIMYHCSYMWMPCAKIYHC